MGKPEENDNKYFVAFAVRLQRSLVVFRGLGGGGGGVVVLKSRLCQRLNAPKCQLFFEFAGSATRKI